jgi:WD40 repeat protein
MSLAPAILTREADASRQLAQGRRDGYDTDSRFRLVEEDQIFFRPGIYDFVFSHDGTRIAFSGDLKTEILVMELSSRRVISRFDRAAHHGRMTFDFVPGSNAILTTPVEDRVVGRPLDNVASVVDTDTGAVLRQFSKPEFLRDKYLNVLGLSVHPRDRQAIVLVERRGGAGRDLFSLNLDDGALEPVPSPFPGGASIDRNFAIGPDGVLALSSLPTPFSREIPGRIALVDLRSGMLRHSLQGHASSVSALAWSGDGKLLGSAGGVPNSTATANAAAEGEAIWVWEANSGRLVSKFGEAAIMPAYRVALSQDGRWVAGVGILPGSSSRSTLAIWERTTGREVFRRVPDGAPDINQVKFSPDGSRFAWHESRSVKLFRIN